MTDGLSIQDYTTLLNASRGRMAMIALLSYDATLTFGQEIQRIWGRKFTLISLSYFPIRYCTLVYYLGAVLDLLMTDLNDSTCSVMYHLQFVSSFLKRLAIAMVVTLRVYGISGQNWMLALLIFPIALFPAIWTLVYAIDVVAWIEIPHSQFGCVYDPSRYSSSAMNGLVNTAWYLPNALALVSESMLVAVTWYATFRIKLQSHRLGMKTPLFTLLIRDGTLYFLTTIATNAVILYLNGGSAMFNETVAEILSYSCDAISSMVLSRFLLNLRGLYFTGTASTTSPGTQQSSMFFRRVTTSAIGNLGATVQSGTNMPNVDPEEWDERADDVVFCDDPFTEGMTASPGLDRPSRGGTDRTDT